MSARILLPLRFAAVITFVSLGLGTSGCGGKAPYNTDGSALSVSPESVTLEQGQSQVFEGHFLEYGPTQAGFQTVEQDAGTIVNNSTDVDANPFLATYTAPMHPGTYHVRYTITSGSSNVTKAFATVKVK